jgi:hypothetical protein
MNYIIGDIITYPVPGVVVGNCEKNTVDKNIRIINIYENLSNDGIIIEGKIIDDSVKGLYVCKLLHTINYKV